jgi:hypothetical protein
LGAFRSLFHDLLRFDDNDFCARTRAMQPLWDHESVVDVLGGPVGVGNLIGFTLGTTVYGWVKRRRFPPEHYFVMKDALADKGFFAPMTLWRFTEPAHKLRQAA